jgi:hypothetical protein
MGVLMKVGYEGTRREDMGKPSQRPVNAAAAMIPMFHTKNR